jgi:TRAP-type uncharacterized transport system substrate-binding protein
LTSVPGPSPTALRHVHRCLLVLLTLAVAACAGKAGPSAPSGRAAPPAAAQKAADTIYIGTGAVTGVYYPAGGGICRMVNRSRGEHDMNCAIESTEGSIANIEGLRRRVRHGHRPDDAQFDAIRAPAHLPKRAPIPTCALFAHAEPFTVVARGSWHRLGGRSPRQAGQRRRAGPGSAPPPRR